MIYTVVGARPNFIKIDPKLPQVLVHTGQHFEPKMSRVFFKELELPTPKYNLGCKGKQVGKMIDKLRLILRRDKPSLVLVFGDTHSSVAGALAAKYEGIKVAHVEAGMRSGDKTMPEEINRITIDHVADVNFCTNPIAVMNLLREGITEHVYEVGDPLVDTLFRFIPIQNTPDKGKYILVTIHREVNANKKWMDQFMKILGETDEQYVFPVHPRTKRVLKAPKNVKVIDPQSYGEMLSLQSNAKKVITDSGGVQRESAWMNVPVIVMRDRTEWIDLERQGKIRLSDFNNLKHDIESFNPLPTGAPRNGANVKIKDILVKYV